VWADVVVVVVVHVSSSCTLFLVGRWSLVVGRDVDVDVEMRFT
jgi:hypothetical protein